MAEHTDHVPTRLTQRVPLLNVFDVISSMVLQEI